MMSLFSVPEYYLPDNQLVIGLTKSSRDPSMLCNPPTPPPFSTSQSIPSVRHPPPIPHIKPAGQDRLLPLPLPLILPLHPQTQPLSEIIRSHRTRDTGCLQDSPTSSPHKKHKIRKCERESSPLPPFLPPLFFTYLPTYHHHPPHI